MAMTDKPESGMLPVIMPQLWPKTTMVAIV
jgi:hypothetical protein